MKGKNKVSIQAKRRLFFLRPICFFLIFFMIITFISNSVRLYNLTNEKKQKEQEYLELQEESEYLKNEITKLSDPEYLAKYARENYSYSKDGELIIKVDDSKKEKVDVETNLVNENSHMKIYFIIGVCLMVLYLFITIIRRKNSE